MAQSRTSSRSFAHLTVIPGGTSEPLLRFDCFSCLDTGIDLRVHPDNSINAQVCSKCTPYDQRVRWNEKTLHCSEINRLRIVLVSKWEDASIKLDYAISEHRIPASIKGRIEDLFSNIAKPGPRTPVSKGELGIVANLASSGKLWAGKLEENETTCPHLISRIPALFRPEVRGKSQTVPEDHIIRPGWHGEAIVVKPHILTTAHQRVVLALTQIHHVHGFKTNLTHTSYREIVGIMQKTVGGSGAKWVKEKLNEIQECKITIVNDLGGIYGTTDNSSSTEQLGCPIFSYREVGRGLEVSWNEYFLVQYHRRLYSRINLSIVLSLPPIAQLIYIFLVSHDRDNSFMSTETWMSQLGLENTRKARQNFSLAVRSLEKSKVLHPNSIVEKYAWLFLTRGNNFYIPSWAPENIKLIAEAIKRPKVANPAQDTSPVWSDHSVKRSTERAGATCSPKSKSDFPDTDLNSESSNAASSTALKQVPPKVGAFGPGPCAEGAVAYPR